MPPPRARASLLLVMLAALMWGTVGITTRSLYELTPTNPLSIGFFRLGLAVPPLALACLAVLGRRAFLVPRRDIGRMALIGAMMALYQICYFASIQRVGVAVATLVTLCTAPVITAVLSAIVNPETKSTVRSEAVELANEGLSSLKAYLKKQGVQNEKTFAEVRKPDVLFNLWHKIIINYLN